jgi:hypothetical protein
VCLRSNGADEKIGTGNLGLPLFRTLMRVGVKWARNGMISRWTEVEKEKGKFDYTAQLAFLRDLNSCGISRLERLDGIPVWAASQGTGKEASLHMPRSIEDWRTYVETTMSTLGPLAQAYEVWNEPDIPERFWRDGIPEMMKLLNAAFDARSKTAPKAMVLMPGFAGAHIRTEKPQKKKWFEQALKDGNYDIINFHSYGSIEMHERRFQVLDEILKASNLPRKPIWITECNTLVWAPAEAQVGPNASYRVVYTEGDNARNHVWWHVIGRFHGAEKLFTHGTIAYADDEDYSMIRLNLCPRPIMLAQAAMARILHNSRCVREFSTARIRAFEYKEDAVVNVLWNRADAKPVRVEVTAESPVRNLDMMGNLRDGPGNSGTKYQMDITDYPVYVVGSKISIREL